MSIIDPIIGAPVVVPPLDAYGYEPFPNVQPFSPRAGIGYQDQLEYVQHFLQRKLIPYLTLTNPQGTWDTNIAALITAVDAALLEQSTENAQKIADALAAIAQSQIIITDPAIVAVLNSATSNTLKFLDNRYIKPGTIKFITDRFSPAPSGQDDTAALQAWLDTFTSRDVARMRTGSYRIEGTLTIPAGVLLEARAAKFTAYGTVQADVFHFGAGSWVIGAEVTFASRPGGRPMLINAVSGVRVVDCYIHDIKGQNVNDGPGIRAESGASKYLLRGNRIENVNGQGIAVDFAPFGTITENLIDAAYHGIQWWGGDSASDAAIGIHHLIISSNRVRNVHGGIWGSLGSYITVTGNEVDNCADIGIDFEGCSDSTAVGNTVQRCVNAGLAVYFGSTRIRFSGNSVDNRGYAGCGFKSFANKLSSYISVTDNTINVDQGIAISTDQQSLGDSTFSGNRITALTRDVLAARFLECGNITFSHNEIRVACPTAVSFEGGTDSRIEGNEIITVLDGSQVGATSAGIYLVYRSANFPCKRNRVRNNTLRGFVQGIFDNCFEDKASATLIENNISSRIITRNGSNVQLFNNRDENLHAPVNPTII